MALASLAKRVPKNAKRKVGDVIPWCWCVWCYRNHRKYCRCPWWWWWWWWCLVMVTKWIYLKKTQGCDGDVGDWLSMVRKGCFFRWARKRILNPLEATILQNYLPLSGHELPMSVKTKIWGPYQTTWNATRKGFGKCLDFRVFDHRNFISHEKTSVEIVREPAWWSVRPMMKLSWRGVEHCWVSSPMPSQAGNKAEKIIALFRGRWWFIMP